jgi:hypothetical protein
MLVVTAVDSAEEVERLARGIAGGYESLQR